MWVGCDAVVGWVRFVGGVRAFGIDRGEFFVPVRRVF